MPTVKPGAIVLVSGANGYIAAWVVRTLLEHGYRVRGTVRSEEKGKHLREMFSADKEKLELVVVPDITKEDAFDEAVKGVDAIEHTASPFHFNSDDPAELINPAVQGTVNMLRSALKYGLSVQRIVVTSSCAAVLEVSPNPRTFSEKDWNEKAITDVKENGRQATNASKYQASKALAEKAAWEFWNEHRSSVKWDLVVLNPPYVFGPGIHEVKSVKSLNTSLLEWYNKVILGKALDTAATQGSSWVDVRDLAVAHMKAIEYESASGERIIISQGPFMWQNWVDTANSIAPSILEVKLPQGYPDKAKNAPFSICYDTSKADKLLQMQYRSMETTTKDTLLEFEAKGWLKRHEAA